MKYFLSFFLLIGVFYNGFSQTDSLLVVKYDYVFRPSYDKGFIAKHLLTLVVGDSTYELRKEFPKILNSSIPQPVKFFNEEIFMGFNNSNVIYHFISKNDVYDEVVVKDSIPDFNWHITKQKKKIGRFECYKATTNFRGSNVAAFFTYEIPISLGPHKFRGLPGMILEAKSHDLDHTWSVTNIKYISATDNVLYNEFNFGNVISLQLHVENNENIDKEMRKVETARLKSALDKVGGTFIGIDDSYTRSGLEKIYEWELENEKK